ncbi:hypothetical protein RAB80_018262 [Fusarium oxysporum f. sp. vasinfectum]|nr:hypothetical protein RAB80_018262 [Fusarium oxysporum f. sp. vasinfectum]
MHSLVHLAIRSWVAENESEKEQNKAAISRLEEVFPTDKWENRDVWRQFLPHAIKILRRAGDDWRKELCKLGYWVGRCLLVDGRGTEAVELLEHVVGVWETTLADNHPDRLASQHELAVAYRVNGQIKEAVKLLDHVVTMRETALAENHPSRLASQHELAVAYQANGQIKEAVTLLEHVVAVRERTLAEDHPHRLASQHEFAIAYRANGQIKEAVKLLEHVVTVQETTLAEDHPHRLAPHALAMAYQANGQIKEALKLLEHVVAVRERTLAEDHPHRLASQHEFAIAYRANGQIKEAVKLLEHVVAVRERTLAEDHPDRLASQHALAVAYRANGQIKEAVKLLEHVVAVRETTLAEDHPHRLAPQHALAMAYQANGQIKEALKLLEHVVAVQGTTLAENHPSRLASQHALAGVYEANGQIAEAVKLLEHYLLQQGAEISRFRVHPEDEEFVTKDSRNPFSLAWYWQRYAIFLLLLDATLTHECRKTEWVHIGPLSPLSEGGPRERLAERLTIWLRSRSSKLIDDEDEYEGPDVVISRTLELVFGIGMYLRGDNILVGLLIEKNAQLPEFVLGFLRDQWHDMNGCPYSISWKLRHRPTILEITFTALPLIQQSDEGDCWLIRVANALKKEGLPLTYDSLEQKLGQQWSLMQKTIPF